MVPRSPRPKFGCVSSGALPAGLEAVGVRCFREVVGGGGMTRNLAGVRALLEICLPPLVHGCRRDFIEA
jgi:hypothetical protein